MKLNERSLSFYATGDSPADNAGFLHKKGERNAAYHRRWFVLKGNMLFYFEDRESREPVGVIILEGCTVELCEAAEDFAFAIRFPCPKSRTYVLAAESQATMEGWVKALSRASFGYLRLVVRELEKQLEETQRDAAGGCRVQRRAPLYRKNRTAPNLELAALGPARPLEKPALLGGLALKENSCALWNNSEGPPTNACKGCDGELKPPPLPPRRRSLPGYSGGAGSSGVVSPTSPSALCFSRLHDWYGKEILQLRRSWLEQQKASGL